MIRKLICVLLCAALCISIVSCGSVKTDDTDEGDTGTKLPEAPETPVEINETEVHVIEKEDIAISQTIENSSDGGHAVEADGESLSYTNTAVSKTGDSSGDEADFYGDNSAVFATGGGSLDLSEMVITTDGTHANAVFCYGEGTSVTIRDSVIETSGNCSGGIMTTGGGTMNAVGLNIHTTGNSSAAIRSDRGGGTVTVSGGIICH